jgi:hypothetical protein
MSALGPLQRGAKFFLVCFSLTNTGLSACSNPLHNSIFKSFLERALLDYYGISTGRISREREGLCKWKRCWRAPQGVGQERVKRDKQFEALKSASELVKGIYSALDSN